MYLCGRNVVAPGAQTVQMALKVVAQENQLCKERNAEPVKARLRHPLHRTVNSVVSECTNVTLYSRVVAIFPLVFGQQNTRDT